MDRKEFLRRCGSACAGGLVLSVLAQGCRSLRASSFAVEGSHVIIPLSEFVVGDGSNNSFHQFVIAYPDLLQYPLGVFRHGEKDFTAVLLRCTHQGTELQVFGDVMQCPAHGSEFDARGRVQQGPASTDLITFPIAIEPGRIRIALQ